MRFMLLLGVVLCACSSGDSTAPPGVDDTGTTSDGGDTAIVFDGDSAGTDGTTTDAPVTTPCEGNCHYVRAAASGKNDGTDWTNAWRELPAVLQRGHVYFVAEGSYAGYVFDDPAAGTQPIRVLRATDLDHGTPTGWDATFGSGTATFGRLQFKTTYYELDGRKATRVVGPFKEHAAEIAAGFVQLENADLDGDFQMTGGKHTGGACAVLSINASDVVVSGNRIHDAADDGVEIGGARRVSFVGNEVYRLHGCGTDGGCGPCYNGHSDGFELYDVKDSDISGNYVHEMTSTSAFFFGNWADELGKGPIEYCENITLTNNVFYSPDTGFSAYFEDVKGLKVFHNVFWGLRQGAYGGLSIGTHVTGLSLYNNVILSINFTHIGGKFDPAEHKGDYNLFGVSLGQWTNGTHDVVVGDPAFTKMTGMNGPKLVDALVTDFTPKPTSPLKKAGLTSSPALVLPAVDFFGTLRGTPPTIGAIE